MSREALVVGINRYPLFKDNFGKPRNLLKPAADAEAIAHLLETYGNFRVQRFPAISVEDKWQVDPHPAGRKLPKASQLKKAIEQLFFPPTSVPDTALLFFAGHGLLDSEGAIREGFLGTSDINLKKNNWGISLRWLRQLLQESPVRQQIVWLDCCHSGALLNFSDADPGPLGKSRDRCFIAAARDFEVAYEQVGGEHGVLTSSLLPGLNPEEHPETWVTNYSLVDYVRKQLAATRQRPLFHNTGGEIILTGKKEEMERAVLMSGVCPYKGLESFGFNDEDPKYFYGRTALTDQLLDKVRSGNFLAVLGASGSGKSSVVKAGLLYQLQLGQRLGGSDTWQIKIFRPGEHPLLSLAEVFISKGLSESERKEQLDKAEELLNIGATGLAELVGLAASGRLVLVVDQFEEAFTLTEKSKEREEFFDCLLGALDLVPDNKLCLIITMRADFFGKCAEQEYAGLAEKIEQHMVTVKPMKQEELEEAIIQPAKKVGLEVQRELVQQILGDVSGPGILPLLQYTLTELWLHRQVNRLSLPEYTKLGGVKGALQKRANEAYQALSDEEQLTAKRIFMELTQLGEGTEDTRRQIFKLDLVNEQQPEELVDRVIDNLVDARLLVTSQLQGRGEAAPTITVIDVAHETLIRHWSLLRSWVDENREIIRIERRIEAGAEEWEQKNKPSDYLLGGSRLTEAENYLTDYGDLGYLSTLGKEYIDASIKWRQQQEQQKKKRRRNTVVSLATFSVISLGLASFAAVQLWRVKKAEQLRQEQLIHSTWISLKPLEINYDNCKTWLEFGVRDLYCRIKPFVSYRKLIAISGLPIFRSGPHSDSELNFEAGYEFGYYNPEFLKWIQENVIIDPDDYNFKQQIQSAYDNKIRVVARAFYQTHQILFAPPEEFETFKKEYKSIQEEYQEMLRTGKKRERRFDSDPLEFEVIKSRYLERIQNKSVPAEGFHGAGFMLTEDCRWLADYLATKNENSYKRMDERQNYWYLANVAGGFWVRRSIDGTEKQFFDILTKLLEIYDSDWLNEQKLLDTNPSR